MKKFTLITCSFLTLAPITSFAGDGDQKLFAGEVNYRGAFIKKYEELRNALVAEPNQENANTFLAFLKTIIEQDPSLLGRYKPIRLGSNLGIAYDNTSYNDFYNKHYLNLGRYGHSILMQLDFLGTDKFYISNHNAPYILKAWPHIETLCFEGGIDWNDEFIGQVAQFLTINKESITTLKNLKIQENEKAKAFLPMFQAMPNLKTIYVYKSQIAMYQAALPHVQVLEAH